MIEIGELSFGDLLDESPEPPDWSSRRKSRASIAEFADALHVRIAAVQEDRPRAALRKLSEAISALHADVKAATVAMRPDLVAGQETCRAATRRLARFERWSRRLLERLRRHLLAKILLPILARIEIAIVMHQDCYGYLSRLRELCLRYSNRTGPADHCFSLARHNPTGQGVVHALH